MKRCPSCQRTYEDDSQAFCFTDGTRLVDEGQAYDSQKTMVGPPPQPEPTQYYQPDKQTGPASPYSTQGEPPSSWPQAGGAQSGQQAWPPAQTPPPPLQQTPSWGTPQSPYQQSAPFASTVVAQGQRRGLGIAALVLGIMSIQDAFLIFFRWVYPYSSMRAVAFLAAFVGMILGAVALTLSMTNPARHAGRGLALAGIITSFLSLFLILVGRGI
jgi:hypothetical protein